MVHKTEYTSDVTHGARMSGRKRDELDGVISLCRQCNRQRRAIRSRHRLHAKVIRRYYPETNSLQDFCTDAAAIRGLSDVLQSQNDGYSTRAPPLYKDPFYSTSRYSAMDISAIADSFSRAGTRWCRWSS